MPQEKEGIHAGKQKSGGNATYRGRRSSSGSWRERREEGEGMRDEDRARSSRLGARGGSEQGGERWE